MAREPIEVIRAQFGLLMVEIARLTSDLEKRDEQIVELESKLKALEKQGD